MRRPVLVLAIGVWCGGLVASTDQRVLGQEPVAEELIPHAQDRPPNPPKTPAQALASMSVPEGFSVELVASEPELVNPVSMCFDERGRIWVTESLEYPRRDPGAGRDRVQVLEDTDGDGRADSFTTFAEGLNIPSGIAVGHGGVWVANSPDILFIPDANRDARPDGPPVVVATGFGRDDTHELPNSLTWGPDGWLYGWNGVFNPSRVTSNNGKTYAFTCAIWRIHPRTREFQVWCEGTSNPWGIAINDEGSFFASACVIDHLWHLVEGAYYIRQGGPYPPHTWPMRSIVDHVHQKAAYCGITWFDSPAYPPEYRKRLYMGNIHGNCINVDTITSSGASYRAEPAADFLTANDAWFMPVSQKTGPDGCLYVLDWYDRYHCYQDANRDPAGIDRLKGRLYRVRYRETPRRTGFDMADLGDEELIRRLANENPFDRETARRLLTERIAADPPAREEAIGQLAAMARGDGASLAASREALWTLIGAGPLPETLHRNLAEASDPVLRAWSVRAAGDRASLAASAQPELVLDALDDNHPTVRLQAIIAAAKVARGAGERLQALRDAVAHENDPLTSHVIWQSFHNLLDDPAVIALLVDDRLPRTEKRQGLRAFFWPRAIEQVAANNRVGGELLARLVKKVVDPANAHEQRRESLEALERAVRERAIRGDRLTSLRENLGPFIGRFVQDETADLHSPALALAASWGDEAAIDRVRARFMTASSSVDDRIAALRLLVSTHDPQLLDCLAQVLAADDPASVQLHGRLLPELGKLDGSRLADTVLAAYKRFSPESRVRAVDLLIQRTEWTRALLEAVEKGVVEPTSIDVNQVRRLQRSKDPEIAAFVRKTWGTVRAGRNEAREQVVARMRQLLGSTPGDPFAGRTVFENFCAQCHKIYGKGQEVGPEITSNGRNDFDQLVSNVFDPNLVIGPVYQAVVVGLNDGRVITGLLTEDGHEKITLRQKGGKEETVARSEIDELVVSPVSLMPEEIETQLTPRELIDLFSFLALDKPPEDPTARRLPGAPEAIRAKPPAP